MSWLSRIGTPVYIVWLHRLQVALPEVGRKRLARLGGFAPHLLHFELHAVERLQWPRGVAEFVIWKLEESIAPAHNASFSPEIPWEARVPPWVHHPGADLVPGREALGDAWKLTRRAEAGMETRLCYSHDGRICRVRDGRMGHRRIVGGAFGQLLGRDDALVDQPRNERLEMAGIVTGVEIHDWIEALNLIAKFVEWEELGGCQDEAHSMLTALPRLVEHGLVFLPRDAPKSVHAPHIVNAVHATSVGSASASPTGRYSSRCQILVPHSLGRRGRT